MNVVIVGNGAIGLMTAFELLNRDSKLNIQVIGKLHRPGSASLAAAAMFNSLCEIDKNTLNNKFETKKFEFNAAATPLWPEAIKKIEDRSKNTLEHAYGTYLINNHCTDHLEDENFDAILEALKKYQVDHEVSTDTSIIKNYNPGQRERASRLCFIPGEGWINPQNLIHGLSKALESYPNVTFIDDEVHSLEKKQDQISQINLSNGNKVFGDIYILCPGATFSKIINASDLEMTLPKIFYGVGCSILIKTGEETMSNCVRTPNRGLACGIYSAPQQGNTHTVVGASNFISPVPEEHVRLTSVHTLIDGAIKQLNHNFYRAQLVKVNVGWRPTSEDTVPLIGKTSLNNLIIATGTKRDGLHCSPLIAKSIGEIVFDGKSKYDISLFSPERKPHKVYSREEAVDIYLRNVINAAYQHGFTPSMDRMQENLIEFHKNDIEELHDKVGAKDWGIPPEMINMYRYGHAS